ncbi:hypothetical protein [Craterilacuibacter sinensis]|uniref:Uncharacterized protein n=1 Tax=Craterilacuibacter sinensis TaxID=2686017 RepID=A0A845BRR5_9NEIS|nr:hypothetical protein [Craterilacuibacter sinensis]MXR37848.1 hypothetical protein [Craterilacuibacter sinensis]
MAKGWLSQEEFAAVTRARRLKREVIMVDDFDKSMTHHDEQMLSRVIF